MRCCCCTLPATCRVVRKLGPEPLCDGHLRWLHANVTRPFVTCELPVAVTGYVKVRKPELARRHSRTYYQRHRAEILQSKRTYYWRNQAQRLAYSREYKQRQREAA